MSDEASETGLGRSSEDQETAKVVRRLLQPAWITDRPSLWPAVRKAMSETSRDRRARASGIFGPAPRTWSWAAAAMAVAAASVGLALFGLRSHVDRPGPAAFSIASAAAGPRIEVLSSVLEGSPAKAYVFQTRETSFVWLTPGDEAGRGK